MIPLNHDYDCGEPLAMSHTFTGTYTPKPGEMDMLNKVLEESDAQLKLQVDEYVEQLLKQYPPDLLEEDGHMQLVVANETMAGMVRSFLVERGHENIKVVVAAPLSDCVPEPRNVGNYWTPAIAEAKAAYAASHDALGQRVRHHSQFTKAQPTPKARKAARKRAKAARRASR